MVENVPSGTSPDPWGGPFGSCNHPSAISWIHYCARIWKSLCTHPNYAPGHPVGNHICTTTTNTALSTHCPQSVMSVSSLIQLELIVCSQVINKYIFERRKVEGLSLTLNVPTGSMVSYQETCSLLTQGWISRCDIQAGSGV